MAYYLPELINNRDVTSPFLSKINSLLGYQTTREVLEDLLNFKYTEPKLIGKKYSCGKLKSKKEKQTSLDKTNSSPRFIDIFRSYQARSIRSIHHYAILLKYLRLNFRSIYPGLKFKYEKEYNEKYLDFVVCDFSFRQVKELDKINEDKSLIGIVYHDSRKYLNVNNIHQIEKSIKFLDLKSVIIVYNNNMGNLARKEIKRINRIYKNRSKNGKNYNTINKSNEIISYKSISNLTEELILYS